MGQHVKREWTAAAGGGKAVVGMCDVCSQYHGLPSRLPL